MPNWCSTKIEFTGTTADLADFHDKIVKYTTTELASSGFGKDWLGNVLHGFGLGDRIDSEHNRIRCRGSISDISDINIWADKTSFTVWTETAWVPMVHMWYVIIEKYYDNRISVHWIAEEEGCGYYATNDIGWFGIDYYHVEWAIEDEDEYGGEYCDSPDEVVYYVNSLIEKYNLDTNPITEDDINRADDNGKDFFLNGDGWSIACLILREVDDSDMD